MANARQLSSAQLSSAQLSSINNPADRANTERARPHSSSQGCCRAHASRPVFAISQHSSNAQAKRSVRVARARAPTFVVLILPLDSKYLFTSLAAFPLAKNEHTNITLAQSASLPPPPPPHRSALQAPIPRRACEGAVQESESKASRVSSLARSLDSSSQSQSRANHRARGESKQAPGERVQLARKGRGKGERRTTNERRRIERV